MTFFLSISKYYLFGIKWTKINYMNKINTYLIYVYVNEIIKYVLNTFKYILNLIFVFFIKKYSQFTKNYSIQKQETKMWLKRHVYSGILDCPDS